MVKEDRCSTDTAGSCSRVFHLLTIGLLLVCSIFPQTQAQQQCSDHLLNCTSNSLNITVLSGTTNDTCATPDDSFVFDLTLQLDAPIQTRRYDVALWIPEEPSADIGNLSSADQCHTNLINPDGHNLDGDWCDDVDGAGGTVETTQSFNLSCDWDNQPLKLVVTWELLGSYIPNCTEPTTTTGSNCLATVGEVIVSVDVCGDGVLDPSEQCDDGNNAGGDGCDAMCQIEPSCPVDECFFQDSFETFSR